MTTVSCPMSLESVITEQSCQGQEGQVPLHYPNLPEPHGLDDDTWNGGSRCWKLPASTASRSLRTIATPICAFEGEDVTSFHSLDETGRVIYVGSFSKIIAPGMRMGYLVAPQEVINRAWSFKSGGAVSQFTALAVAEYMKGGIDQHIEAQNQVANGETRTPCWRHWARTSAAR